VAASVTHLAADRCGAMVAEMRRHSFSQLPAAQPSAFDLAVIHEGRIKGHLERRGKTQHQRPSAAHDDTASERCEAGSRFAQQGHGLRRGQCEQHGVEPAVQPAALSREQMPTIRAALQLPDARVGLEVQPCSRWLRWVMSRQGRVKLRLEITAPISKTSLLVAARVG